MIQNIKARKSKFESRLKKEMINKIMHSIYGNIQHDNLTIMQFNKANGDMANKIPQINEILIQHKPHVLVVNEAQLSLSFWLERVFITKGAENMNCH